MGKESSFVATGRPWLPIVSSMERNRRGSHQVPRYVGGDFGKLRIRCLPEDRSYRVKSRM